MSGHPNDVWEKRFALVAGGCLGISLLKFGNPVIFEALIEPPTGFWEFVFQPWPVAWGYCLLVGVALLGFKAGRLATSAPRWLVILPLVWLGWQFLSSTQTVDARLSRATLVHFCSCAAWFYLGLFVLGRGMHMASFLTGLLVAFIGVLWAGFEQHYGGLEATRRYVYEQTDWRRLSPDYLKKIASNRIFSTLVYPNALAAAILLLLPVLLVRAGELARARSPIFRRVLVGLLGYGGLACLYWSGSKAGWLVAILMLGAFALEQGIPRRMKVGLMVAVVVVGTMAFAVRYGDYFRKGATSAVARFDYWQAAIATARANPVFGTGPGTFAIPYRKLKRPEAEMARLTHNDYLEQASDSGLVGFLSYSGFIGGALAVLYRRRNIDSRYVTAMRLGILGWAVHSIVEFSLYVPALAWPAFAFLGCLLAGVASREIKSTTHLSDG